MYAVMKTGGKQYRVEAGDVLRIEKIAADAGETVQFNDVMMVGGNGAPTIGAPLVDGAAVQAEVIDQIKGPKTINFVKRRRKHGSKRTKGHRQQLTLLRVTEIVESGGDTTGVKTAIGAAGMVMAGAAAVTAAMVGTNASAAAQVMDAVANAIPGDGAAPQKPANLTAEPPASGADDLKRLSGVGPKLHSKLNDNGVWTFAQIAAWTPEEVAFMDDQLSFKGRIARDDWIGQAARFDAEKSGTAGQEE
jgi:large subunit ribosomal protein L21